MTDEQFDEIARGAIAYDAGSARLSGMTRTSPRWWNWLPTVPEILACGCACGLGLLVVGFRVNHQARENMAANPVVQKSIGGSFAGLQASTLPTPDPALWTQPLVVFPPYSTNTTIHHH